MAADGLDASSRVILKGSGNWDVWISVIRKFAKNQQVWDYINPDVVQKPSLTPPVEPTPGQVQENAAEIQQLQGDSLSKFQILEARHRSQLQIYKDKAKALATLQEYIVKTVGKYYDIIAKEDDTAKELTILRNRVKPTDWARESEVTDRYYATLKEVSRTKVETWISKWQVTLNEAKNLDLPDVRGLRPTRHFLKAVNAVDPTFSKVWINQMEANALSHEDDPYPTRMTSGKRRSLMESRSVKFLNGHIDQLRKAQASQVHSPPSKEKGSLMHPTQQQEPRGKANLPLRSQAFLLGEEIDQKLQDPTIKGKVERSIRNRKKREEQSKQQNESEVKGTAFAGAGAVAKAQPEDTQPTQELSDGQTQSMFSTAAVYPLRDSFILDSGSDFHICNNSKRFVEGSYKVCDTTETAYSGDTHLKILGYGDVIIRIGKTDKFRLQNVAYVPRFHTNVASLDLFLQRGYNWNPATSAVSRDGKTIFRTERRYRQPVIEFNQVDYESHMPLATAFTSSTQPRPESAAEATQWHQRLGHLGSEAPERLVQQTTGAKIKGPLKIECKDCAVAKAKRIVSRRSPRTKAPRPFWRIYVDIFAMSDGYKGMKHAVLIRDEYTSMIYIYLLRDATTESVLGVLKAFEAYIRRQFDTSICVIHRDNDRALQSEYVAWVRSQGIDDEPTAPDTPAQNGPAERSGGVIGSQSRTMQVGANFPDELWPETWKTAVYLHNRSPQQANNWKTPFERLHQWLQENNRDTGYLQTQPDITHLKAYGCRAYPLTREALQGKQKKSLKIHPHAEIGYLVGYDSTNIFRIWIPERKEVRRVRDVTFDETRFYDPRDHPQKLHIEEAELQLQLPAHIESDPEPEKSEEARTEAHSEPKSPPLKEAESEDETRSTIWVGGQDHSDEETDQELESFDSQATSQTVSPTPDESHRDSFSPDLQDQDNQENRQDHDNEHEIEIDDQSLREAGNPLARKSLRQRKPSERAREAAAGSCAVYRSSFFIGREQKLHR
ncbi:Retrovirus-related Pol polyprotein from transposon TNT 1-94 [Metarhizium brunneum]|uniref:Retrovirus-related Pol polyprotein from transposon TNT 1-94 n=1 Tax=Metarhizium brunneum TaxID=500148 RepID=A0A7D5V0W6_9HYPO|nr:Retrovirus-related Pol polyprotein from transposon TNT 1-94 [Metarhizium brunneum]